MPKIVREDVDNLNAVLSITLEKADYEPRFEAELVKYRQKASFKGFRKGKTPKRVLKKMVGRSVLGDIINEMIQQELIGFLSENPDMNLLGQPIPSESQEPLDIDLNEMRDYEFRFDLGFSPEFEVQGLTKDTVLKKYAVSVPEEQIDQEMEAARRQFGERIYPEDIQEGDFLKLSVRELADGEIKEDGLKSEFSLLVDSIADEAIKQEMLNKKLGDAIRVNLMELEGEQDEAYVRKYYLNLGEDDETAFNPEFEATIEEVSRIEEAEMNQEFFDKFFGEGEVSNEEEAREKVRERIRARYDQEAEGLLSRDLQDLIMEQNEMELPDGFLKRWLLASNENLTEEQLESTYEGFQKNLRWTLIRNKLVDKLDISVEEEEIKDAFKLRIQSYFGNSSFAGDDFLDGMVGRLMEDQQQYDQVRNELLEDKLYGAMAEEITVEEEPIEVEAFQEVVQEARVEAMKARGEIDEEE